MPIMNVMSFTAQFVVTLSRPTAPRSGVRR
jgi:hypothetical protein